MQVLTGKTDTLKRNDVCWRTQTRSRESSVMEISLRSTSPNITQQISKDILGSPTCASWGCHLCLLTTSLIYTKVCQNELLVALWARNHTKSKQIKQTKHWNTGWYILLRFEWFLRVANSLNFDTLPSVFWQSHQVLSVIKKMPYALFPL